MSTIDNLCPHGSTDRFFIYLCKYKYYWREMEKLGKNSKNTAGYQLSPYYRNTYRDIQKISLRGHGDTHYLLLTLV